MVGLAQCQRTSCPATARRWQGLKIMNTSSMYRHRSGAHYTAALLIMPARTWYQMQLRSIAVHVSLLPNPTEPVGPTQTTRQTTTTMVTTTVSLTVCREYSQYHVPTVKPWPWPWHAAGQRRRRHLAPATDKSAPGVRKFSRFRDRLVLVKFSPHALVLARRHSQNSTQPPTTRRQVTLSFNVSGRSVGQGLSLGGVTT